MRAFLIVLVLSCSVLTATAYAAAENAEVVSQPKASVLGVELLGRAGLYSIVFDHSINDHLALGAGFEFVPSGGISLIVLPLYANFYPITGPNRFFLTGGLDVATASVNTTIGALSGSGTAFTFGAGYEYRSEGGFLLRFAPYILAGSGGSFVTFGLTIGSAF